VRKADNLPPSCAVVMKSGDLNFLEPSGSLQVCNGTALPFYVHTFVHTYLHTHIKAQINANVHKRKLLIFVMRLK